MRIHSGLRMMGCGIILIGMRATFSALVSLTPAIFFGGRLVVDLVGVISVCLFMCLIASLICLVMPDPYIGMIL